MNRKNISLLVISLLGVSLITGSVFASWIVTDDADPFGINLRIDEGTRNISFYLPDTSDSECMNYENAVVKTVNYGSALSTASGGLPSTSSFDNFTFQGWFTEATFENEIETSDLIGENMSLYAKFTRSNVLYDGSSAYFISEDEDHTIDSRYVWKVASQTWGIQYVKDDDDKIDLLTTSGIYKTTYGGEPADWTILRKIGVSINPSDKAVSGWWGDNGAMTYVYGRAIKGDESPCYMGGTLSAVGYHLNGTGSESHYEQYYMDYSLIWLGVIRWNPDPGNGDPALVDNNTKIWNYTGMADVANNYTKDCINLNIWEEYSLQYATFGALNA